MQPHTDSLPSAYIVFFLLFHLLWLCKQCYGHWTGAMKKRNTLFESQQKPLVLTSLLKEKMRPLEIWSAVAATMTTAPLRLLSFNTGSSGHQRLPGKRESTNTLPLPHMNTSFLFQSFFPLHIATWHHDTPTFSAHLYILCPSSSIQSVSSISPPLSLADAPYLQACRGVHWAPGYFTPVFLTGNCNVRVHSHLLPTSICWLHHTMTTLLSG